MNLVLSALRAGWRHPRLVLLGVLAVVLAVLTVRVKGTLNDLRTERDSLRITVANQAADLDTVRHLNAGLSARLIRQSDTMRQLRRLATEVVARVDTVRIASPPTVGVAGLTESITLVGKLDTVPIHVVATVTADSNATRWSWLTALDPIPIGVDVGCPSPGRPEVRVRHPDWLKVDSIGGTVTPDLCADRVLKPPGRGSGWPRLLGAAVLGFLVARSL